MGEHRHTTKNIEVSIYAADVRGHVIEQVDIGYD